MMIVLRNINVGAATTRTSGRLLFTARNKKQCFQTLPFKLGKQRKLYVQLKKINKLYVKCTFVRIYKTIILQFILYNIDEFLQKQLLLRLLLYYCYYANNKKVLINLITKF